MIDMTELMFDPDFVQPISIEVLRTQGRYDGHGLYLSDGPRQTLMFIMVIQQSSPKDLMALPEGERNGDFITCWSHGELVVADGVSQEQSDVILWREKPYRVVKCADRSDNGFWEAIAQNQVTMTMPTTMWDDGRTSWDTGQTHWDWPQ